MTTAIKICGITRIEDAEAAVAAGATHIGLIFAGESPRCVEPHAAKLIAGAVKGRLTVVGVFKDPERQAVIDTADFVGFDLVQYHGGETAEFIQSVGLPSIKAMAVAPGFVWQSQIEHLSGSNYVLFDRPKEVADPDWLSWALDFVARAPYAMPPLFFAGGLSDKTVGQVVERLNPYGVDVASGVEQKAGIKDKEKIEAFCRAARGTR